MYYYQLLFSPYSGFHICPVVAFVANGLHFAFSCCVSLVSFCLEQFPHLLHICDLETFEDCILVIFIKYFLIWDCRFSRGDVQVSQNVTCPIADDVHVN